MWMDIFVISQALSKTYRKYIHQHVCSTKILPAGEGMYRRRSCGTKPKGNKLMESSHNIKPGSMGSIEVSVYVTDGKQPSVWSVDSLQPGKEIHPEYARRYDIRQLPMLTVLESISVE
jgi:hypothetical protein